MRVCSGPALILSRRLPFGQHTPRAEDTQIMNPSTAGRWPSRPRRATTTLRNIKTLSCSPSKHKVVFPLWICSPCCHDDGPDNPSHVCRQRCQNSLFFSLTCWTWVTSLSCKGLQSPSSWTTETGQFLPLIYFFFLTWCSRFYLRPLHVYQCTRANRHQGGNIFLNPHVLSFQ